MKKFLLASVVTLGSSWALLAQPERMPFGESMQYSSGKHLFNAESSGAKGINEMYFSDDFEGSSYILSDKWEILRSSTLDYSSTISAANPMWFHCNPESFNGNGATYIKFGRGSAAISYTAPDFTWLVCKDTLPIPQNGEAYLKFWLWYSSNFDQGYSTHFYILAYNTYDHAIDTLNYWGEYDSTSISNQYARRITVPLSLLAGKNIRLAFVYENRNNENKGIQLAVDEVEITNSNSPDISLKAVPFTYSQIPYFTFDSLFFNLYADIYNTGAAISDTIEIVATSEQLPDINAFATITDTLNEGEQRLAKLNGQAKITENTNYTIGITSSTDQDSITANNSDNIVFSVSQSVYATDHGATGGFTLGENQPFGNIFKVNKPSFIKGIQVGWSPISTIPEAEYPIPFWVAVYQLDPLDSSCYFPVKTGYFEKQYSQVGASSDYPFDEPIYCLPGFSYFVTVTQLSSASLGVGCDGNSYGSFWKRNGSTFKPEKLANPTIGNAAIRLYFNKPIENPIVTFTVKNENNEPVQNARVYVREVDSTLITGVSGEASIELSNGTYTCRLDSAGFAPVTKQVKVFYQDLFIDFKLQKTYQAKFKVLDEDLLTPIAGAEINILSESIDITFPEEPYLTDQNGLDSLQIAPGYYNFSVRASGYNMSSPGYFFIEPSDTLIEVFMQPATTHSLTLQVIDEKGTSLPGAQVTTLNHGAKLTNDNGEALFSNVPEGEISCMVYKENYINNVAGVNLTSDSTVTVLLYANRYTATFFVTSKNVPVYNAQVIVEGIDTAYTSATGYANINLIPFGSNIRYSVKLNGYNTYLGTFNLEDRNIVVNVPLTLTTIEPTKTNSFAIYPNPSNGNFSINLEGSFSVAIYNLAGYKVYLSNHAENSLQVDIHSLPAGIYIVRVTGKNFSTVAKIIKK